MSNILAFLQQFVLADTFIVAFTMIVFIGILEFIFPARNIPIGHYGFNIAFGISAALVNAMIALLIGKTVTYLAQEAGLGLIDLRGLGFSNIGGAFIAMLISTFIYDLLFYWLHRFEHVNQVLWQQHVIHHSDQHMNVTTGVRIHFLDGHLNWIFVTIPMAILFKLPPVTIGVLSLVPVAWHYFIHANLNIHFGSLWWLLASPNYHRIHHSLEREHIDRNFCNWFPILDIAFGTAVRPRPDECPATGVVGVSMKTVTQSLLFPFASWLKMIHATLTRTID